MAISGFQKALQYDHSFAGRGGATLKYNAETENAADTLLQFWDIRQKARYAFVKFDLTFAQAMVLVALPGHGRVGKLALRLGYAKASTSVDLQKLEAKGWISRKKKLRVGESVAVRLTPAGVTLRERVLEAWDEVTSSQEE